MSTITMQRTRRAAAALVLGLVAATTNSFRGGLLAADKDSDNVKLSGCLVKGDAGSVGYLLTNAPDDPSRGSSDRRVKPNAVGTSGEFTQVFYWLNGDDDLGKHIGHHVEVTGERRGELKDGEIKVDRKDRWTEVTVKADGRTMKAAVPSMAMSEGDDGRDKKGHVIIERVDVDHVKMVSARCES